MLNRLYKLDQDGTTVGRELAAGATTFAAMAYILAVNPAILSAAGMPQAALITVTALTAAVSTLLMGFLTNYPLALAPGMGINAYFAFTVCLGLGVSWQSALGLVFVNGCIFLALSVTGIREKIITAIPHQLKLAITCGIGLFIAFIGLKNGGIVVSSPATFVTHGDFGTPAVLLCFGGILLTAVLIARRIPGAIILSILAVTFLGLFVSNGKGGSVTAMPGALFDLPASPMPTMFQLNFDLLLHDFGKVGVREEVLVKAKKLYPAQLEVIKQRLGLVRRTLQNESLKLRMDFLLQNGNEKFQAAQKEFDSRLSDQLRQIDEYAEAIVWANEPTVLPEGNFDQLMEIANLQYEDLSGKKLPILTLEEIQMLSIRKGSLDEEERLQIESHVLHTLSFLQQIPWTNELRNVPEIARGHHEKLNGTGYPYRLSAPEIPVQTRMMTISDIFDALAAADRPYKKAVSIERALEILEL